MKGMNLLAVLLAGVVVVGCSTTSTSRGSRSGLIGFSGKRLVKQSDPGQPADTSQIALEGINGANGDFAAAIGLGSITDPEARKDSLEAVRTISENRFGIWGGAHGAAHGIGFNNRAPALAGYNGGFGRLQNPFTYPITVQIRGLGSPYTFGPGEVQEIAMPHGRYELIIYNAETGQLIGSEKLDTSYRTKFGDKEYDFNVRLDGNDLH